jgi:hypothetical protein
MSPDVLATQLSNHHLPAATEDTMLKAGLLTLLATIGLFLGANLARADDLPCVSTTFRFIGKNDRVCVSAFDDPVPREPGSHGGP